MKHRFRRSLPSIVSVVVAGVFLATWLRSGDGRLRAIDLLDLFSSNTTGVECVVTRIVDGDTIDVSGCETPGRVRLLLIDTPEVFGALECYGPEASAFAAQLLLDRQVGLETDRRETDVYGRMLRYVWLDDMLINEYIVREGYATLAVYPPDVKYVDRIREAEDEARHAGRGLWSQCSD